MCRFVDDMQQGPAIEEHGVDDDPVIELELTSPHCQFETAGSRVVLPAYFAVLGNGLQLLAHFWLRWFAARTPE